MFCFERGNNQSANSSKRGVGGMLPQERFKFRPSDDASGAPV